MLNLEAHINLTDATCRSPNLTSRFSDEDLSRIGQHVWFGYDQDQNSRSKWLQRTRAAMELAMQVKPGKSFPWPNASNVAFPLLTIASLQFHSRAYPALFAGPDIVKYRVPAADPTGELTKRAQLVSRYMSYQVLDEDEAFEEQHDRLLISVPIVGCSFVKTRYSSAVGHNVSEFVPAQDLVIDYYAKSIDAAQRKTQIIQLYRNEVYERCVSGVFRNILDEAWYTSPKAPAKQPGEAEQDRIAGRSQPLSGDDAAVLFLEQHTWLDLDGDGYAEPYIVTIEESSRTVVRIVARWEAPEDIERLRNGKVLRIRATEYFTKYGLVPSPDGSIYDVGFGALLGPLNHSVDTIVNQLIDAGTLKTAAGGFLSRGVKLRGGAIAFNPFQWNTVESTGDDLRKGVFPLPVSEPSAVLFNLLTMLVNYTQRISGSTDVMAGENPGQNTAAHNMQAMIEQGMKIYSAIFKRMWRSMRDEFRKLYLLNGRYLPESFSFGEEVIGREFFHAPSSSLVPVADPIMVSESMKVQQAVTIKQSAATTPGYNMVEVEHNFLRAMHVDGIDVLYPGPDKMPPPQDPKVALEQIKTQRVQMELEAAREQWMEELMEARRLNDAKILQLEADAAKSMAEADGAQAAQELSQLETIINVYKSHNEAINKRLEVMTRSQGNGSAKPAGNGGGMAKPSRNPALSSAPPVASPLLDGVMGGGAAVAEQ